MESVIIVLFMYGLLMLISMGIGAIFYIFNAIALKRISENRGYGKGFLAWVPIANCYVLGLVADDIEEKQGRKTAYRKILIWLSVLAAVFGALMFICTLVGTVISANMSSDSSLVILPFVIVLYVGLLGVMLARMIYQFIAVYKIYKDYAPESATVYLIVSIFVSAAIPFILFSVRNKQGLSMKSGYHIQ